MTVSDDSTPRFVLDESVRLALLLAKGDHLADFLVIPSLWKILFAHYCFFILRLRNAAKGLPVRSFY